MYVPFEVLTYIYMYILCMNIHIYYMIFFANYLPALLSSNILFAVVDYTYRVVNKNCVIPQNVVIFLNSASSVAIDLPSSGPA